MPFYFLCPKCGTFTEVHENTCVVICDKCGLKYKFSAKSNKSYYSKEIHNSLPEYTLTCSLKDDYVTSDRKSNALRDYIKYRIHRAIFNLGCSEMKAGNYYDALKFFTLIPNFKGAHEKYQECRRALSQSVYSEAFDAAVKQLSDACKKFNDLTPANIDNVITIMKYELTKRNIPVDGDSESEILAFARKKHSEFMRRYEPPKRTSDFMIILGVALQGLVMWIIIKILLGALM